MSSPAARRFSCLAVRSLGARAVRKLSAPLAVRRLGAPVRRLGVRAARRLSAPPAVRRLGPRACCEKAECSCCEMAWLVIARD